MKSSSSSTDNMSAHSRRDPGSPLQGFRSTLLILLLVAAICATHMLVDEIVAAQPTSNGSSTSNLSTTINNQRDDEQYQQRQLADIRHDDTCHEDMLEALPSDNSFNLTKKVRRLVFSLENNSTQDVNITSISVYLDTRLEFDFDIFQMDGFYLDRGGTGSIVSTALGTPFDGAGSWQRVARGENLTLSDLTADNDGAYFLPFSSFGGNGSVNVASGAAKSFYMTFTAGIMAVDEENLDGKGETEDMDVVLSTGYSGLKMYVGRMDIFSDAYIGTITQEILSLFYPPARFVGKIWSGLPTCPPSFAPTTAPTTTTQSPTQSPVALPSSVSSQPPSRSPTMSPTHLPSKAPSSFPSKAPSTSPTAAQPTVSPTSNTLPPTKTITPSASPSMPPSLTTIPTVLSSAKPSTQPSTSQAPSFKPSSVPSLHPSGFPSQQPSIAPSPTYNCLVVDDITYDVWYPPMDQEIVEKDIIGNVTKSYQELFEDPDDVLYPLAQSYGLDFCETLDPTVDIISTPGNAPRCITDDKLENNANVCKRFRLQMAFQHSRDIGEGLAKGWLLRVTDRVKGGLKASYSGAKSVMSDQVISFTNARPVEENDKAIFCEAVEDQLIESSYLSNYTILSVTCDRFNFKPFDFSQVPISEQVRGPPFKTRYRGLRRGLQISDAQIGTLDILITVTGKYTYANRIEDIDREVQFDGLVEDSINTDQGNKIVKSLEERKIVAVAGAGTALLGYEKSEAPSPTPVRLDTPKSNPPVATKSSSEDFFGTSGIAAIITSLVVVFVIAGFLFFKGMQRSNVNDEVSELSEDKEENRSRFLAQDLTDAAAVGRETAAEPTDSSAVTRGTHTTPVVVPIDESLSDQEDPKDEPVYYTGTETNIFGEVIGLHTTFNTNQSTNHQEEPLDQNQNSSQSWIGENIATNESIARYGLSSGIRSGLELEREPFHGSHRRSISLDGLDAFEMLVMQKSSALERGSIDSRGHVGNSQGSQSNNQNSLETKVRHGLNRQRSSSLGAGRQDKSSVSPRVLPRSESPASPSALESYEEKILKKLKSKGSSKSTHAGDQQTATLDNFETRLQRKLDNRTNSRNPMSQSTMTFEEKVRRKLFKDDSFVKNSQGSMASFEERMRAKANRGSLTRQRSSSLGAEVSEEKLDYSNAQLQKISETQGVAKHNENMVSTQNIKHVGSQSSLSALEAYEEKVRKKVSKSGNANRVANSPDSHNRQQSLSQGASRRDSQSMLEDFQAKLERKLKKGDGKYNVDSNTSNQNIKRVGSQSSLSALEAFEEKVRKKVSKSGNASREGNSPARLTRQLTPDQLNDFSSRLQKKLEGGKVTQMKAVPVIHKLQGDSEQKFHRKLSKNGSYVHSGDSQGSASSFEERLRAKANSGSLNRQRSLSQGASKIESQSMLEDFQAKLERKLWKAKGRQKNETHSPEQAAGKVDKFEALLRRKVDEEKFKQKAIRSGHPSIIIPSEEKPLPKNGYIARGYSGRTSGLSTSIQGQSKRNNGLSRQRSSSLDVSVSKSRQKLDDFDAKLKQKLEERKRMQTGVISSGRIGNGSHASTPAEIHPQPSKGARGRSAGSPPHHTAKRLEDFNSRLEKKLDDIERNGKGSASTLKSRSLNRRSSSLGATMSRSQRKLADFEARLQKKLERKGQQQDGNASIQYFHDGESTSYLNDLEARILAKSRKS